MTYFPLHDESSNFYADAEDMNDCTVAKLDGSEGDWMMYEPFYWSKGIKRLFEQQEVRLLQQLSGGRNAPGA